MTVIAPARRIRGKQSLQELVSYIPKNYEPGKVDWGGPVVKEVWLVKQYIPEKGDFIAVTFDPQSGHEQKGRRPSLAVRYTLLNRLC
jgi:hypothetical protein